MEQIKSSEFFKKYNNVRFVFKSYYKYMFCYEGETEDGAVVTIYEGGSSDDIYRSEVIAGVSYGIYDIMPTWGFSKKNNKKIHEFDDS